MSTLNIMEGEVLERLMEIPEESIQCVVTSPPYWGLRDYGIPKTSWPAMWFFPAPGLPAIHVPEMDVQLGHEEDAWHFIGHMIHVFRGVHRTLKKDGTIWVNMGDSYCFQKTKGYQPKDLFGMPWKVASALQADGWILRCDIVWHKSNPMPESCKDRPTKAHEYVFMLSKSQRYYYDHEGSKEPVTGGSHPRSKAAGQYPAGSVRDENRRRAGVGPKSYIVPRGWDGSTGEGGHGNFHKHGAERGAISKGKTPGKNSRIHVDRDPAHLKKIKIPRNNDSFSAAVVGLVDKRNMRSVWTIPTFAFKEAHFATFPPKLVLPCIIAGSRVGDTILDPFFGSGTTGLVALENGRNAVGIEINPESVAIARRRCAITPQLHLS